MVVWMGSFVAWTTSLGDTSATNVLSLKKETETVLLEKKRPKTVGDFNGDKRQGFF